MTRPALDTSKLALVYPRQSSGLQVRENIYSLENQLRLLDQAKADGFAADRVLLIDEDLGKSARTIEGRVGMVRALGLVDQGLVGALYAEDQTRLSRDRDTVDHMVIAKRCRAAGVPLFYGGSWRDLGDWGTRVAYKVEAVIGSEMWGLHQEKMFKALQAKAAKGQMAAKAPAYGYRVLRDLPKKDPRRDTLEVVPEEAAIIRELANRLEAIGSLRQLARGIAGETWPDGRPIAFGHLQKLFTKPVFRGHVVWGDVVAENVHEAIISPEQGARIDALLRQNKATMRRPVDEGAQLVGLGWCPVCSRKLTTQASAGKPAYVCKSTPKGPYGRALPAVRHFEIKADAVDRIVLGHLWRRLDAGLVGAIADHLAGQAREQGESADLRESTLRGLRRRVDGLTASLSDPDLPAAARRILILELDQAARELEAAAAPPTPKAAIAADLAFYEALRRDPEQVAALPLGWDDEPLRWRRAWLWRFVERVDVLNPRPGVLEVVTRFRDGSTISEATTKKHRASAAELAAVCELWHHPDRPEVGATAWVAARLAEAGHPVGEATARRLLRRLGIGPLRNPPGQGAPRRKTDKKAAPQHSPAELDLARRLWADPGRPSWAWVGWMGDRLAAAGFQRNAEGVRYLVKRSGAKARATEVLVGKS